MQGTSTKCQEASNLTLNMLATCCFTIIHLQDSFTWVTGPIYADVPSACKQGFQDDGYLQMWWHVFPFSVWKLKPLMNRDYWDQQDHTLEALFMQLLRDSESVLAALWKRNRLCREHRDYGISANAQTAPAFSQTFRKKANQPNKCSCISESSSHSTFLPCAGCAAGG